MIETAGGWRQTTRSSGQLWVREVSDDSDKACTGSRPRTPSACALLNRRRTDAAILPTKTARESALVDAIKGRPPANSSARHVSLVNSPLQRLRSMLFRQHARMNPADIVTLDR
jgi:hypothetical protein